MKIFPEWGKGAGRVSRWYQTVTGKMDRVASKIVDWEGSGMKRRVSLS